MRWKKLHNFSLTPPEAIQLQNSLQKQLRFTEKIEEVQRIAGADMAIDVEKEEGCAAVIIYSFPELIEIERQTARVPLAFPYVPGLLAFREAPALLAAFEKVTQEPNLIFFDGQGVAHPRRFGIASHMGLLLDRPTIGCAKSRLIGTFEEPGRDVGDFSYLYDGEEAIGAVVRTKKETHPIFVSPGHKMNIESAIQWVLRVCDGMRIPKPTREADRAAALVKEGKRPEATIQLFLIK